MVKKLLLSLCFSTLMVMSFAQNYTVKGFVKDAKNKEPIVGAVVYELYTSDNGMATDTSGFFNLSFNKKRAKIKVALIGYKDTLLKLNLKKDTSVVVFLQSETDIEEVEIEDDEINWKPGQDSLKGDPKKIEAKLVDKPEEIKSEEFVNPMRSKETDPGSLNDFYMKKNTDFGQNLIYIDGTRVFGTTLIFDFMPYFQDGTLLSFDYSERHLPARYGDQLSSVLDVKLKEGNMRRYKGAVNFDFFSLGLSVEGPVILDKSSLFFAGRIAWLNNPYGNLFINDQPVGNEYYANPGFHDFHLKYTHKLSDQDRILFSVFRNSNALQSGITEEFQTTVLNSIYRDIQSKSLNNLAGVNWEHAFSPMFLLNTSLHFSQFQLNNTISGDSLGLLNDDFSYINRYNADYRSSNNDLTFKLNFNYFFNPDHLLKFGFNITNHHFRHIEAELNLNDFEHVYNIDTSWNSPSINTQEYVLYVEDNLHVDERFYINGGIHFSAFNSSDKTFYSVQPRIFAEYELFKGLKLHAAYSNYKQYIHYVSGHSVGLDAGIFIPSDNTISPQVTNHFLGGVSLELPFDIYIKADVFYDRMSNVIEYKYGYGFFDYPGTDILTGMNLTERIETGNANLYGIRVLFNKDIDNFKFKIGHTISNHDRQFTNLNFGETFQYGGNRRHDFDFNINWLLSDNFELSVKWIWRSGNYVTSTKQSYIPYNYALGEIGTIEQTIDIYSQSEESIENLTYINDYQLPIYHRLDVGATYKLDNHTFGIKIYNLYNRRNVDFVDFNKSVVSNDTENNLVNYSIMPFFPTLTYSFRFN